MRDASVTPWTPAAVQQHEEKMALRHAVRLVRMRALALDVKGEIPSPCISICRVNESTGWCEGCFRTLGEIASWSSADDEGKRGIWKMIEQRMDALPS